MKLNGRGVQIYDMIINGLQVKKKGEYIKLVVIKQNHSEIFANGFLVEVLYRGLYFHLEIVTLKINKSVAIHARGEKRQITNLYN